jgi:uncharacterized protein
VLDLGPEHLRIVREVLEAHLRGGRAFAFGSRVRGTAKRFSDLDVVLQTDAPVALERLGELRSAFSESDLPIKVDLVDWSGLSPEFRRLIENELVLVYPSER